MEVKAFPIEEISDLDYDEIMFKNTGPQRYFGSIKLECDTDIMVISNHDDLNCVNPGGKKFTIPWG